MHTRSLGYSSLAGGSSFLKPRTTEMPEQHAQVEGGGGGGGGALKAGDVPSLPNSKPP